MELTGVLYGFYSNREITAAFEEFKNLAERINYQFEIAPFFEKESFYSYKDDAMLRYHEENGYNTDLNGEGVFFIEAMKTKLIGIATLFEFEGDSNFHPYDINLALNHVYYYLLTIPKIKEEDVFSRMIHDSVRYILIKE